ncbi:SPRY domain containing protein [Coccidioides posadasii C735 delta SOWgp]|uniref:Protein FYV10 n=1 Tax=Coccidioides posadasii (strain C735) TaxID=222929 RepID=C5PAX0_COCP7|nr:SPRY domain containing protein [Coccidioides posadasii C735 delta SOWgp]EER25754.1 SPRY domain containing protein [Coccidioides posadasii C735 delta SOWgp]|eukprot:XP_003067899.1 SPRY domain containing protein [Coccidioides posadasii C735 delta SOWgp]
MTNVPHSPSGSGRAPNTASFSSGPNIISYPRRSSYASVVSGAASTHPPAWSGAPASLGTATPSSSYPPQYNRLHRQAGYSFDEEMQMNGGASSGNNSWRRAAGLPDHSRQFAKALAYGSGGAVGGGGVVGGAGAGGPIFMQQTNQFFTPSYLKSSKYIAQLAAANKSKATGHKESSSAQSSNAPSLSTSSSNANLHRMAPSHRGMTYDIIEHNASSDEDTLSPLPSRWNELDKYSGLDLMGDGLEVRYMGQANKQELEAAAVRANHPMPPQCGIYYYEVTIIAKSADGMIGMGFSNNKASLERLPGWEQESWAYHGDDGKTFFGDNQGQGKPYGPTFGVEDTIGCGVNFATGTAFFTKNGMFLGNAFRDLKLGKVFPSIGMKKYPGCHVKTNFGQFPFVFDIDGMMAQERRNIQMDIRSTNVSHLHPPLTESVLLQELVAQFLAHDGYVETARAFAEEVREETKALQNGRVTPLKDYTIEDDADAVNRQQIRTAILDGDIDKALELTKTYYDTVLENNPQIYFRLRCRKFLEIVRSYSEPETSQPGKRVKSTNEPAGDNSGDIFTHDMELDHQMQDVQDPEEMDTEPAAKDLYRAKEALEYGQQLKADYMNDDKKQYEKTLNDIFSLVAYSDPKTSPHGHLLDSSGRVVVAEELNSAILVSLGKSSSAALERLYQQTEALINEISEDGGVGAFINVRNDYLTG